MFVVAGLLIVLLDSVAWIRCFVLLMVACVYLIVILVVVFVLILGVFMLFIVVWC